MRAFSVLLTLIIFGLSKCRSQDTGNSLMLGNDYELFQNTPLRELSIAAQNHDIKSIDALITLDKSKINFQKPKFGKTLLMLTVTNSNYDISKHLLEFGADPNMHDGYNGTSAMILATQNTDISFLSLLLASGGNPNDIETGIRQKGSRKRNTPLLIACGQSLEKVKMLIKAGADINFMNEFKTTPLSRALVQDKYDIAVYLIQMGANTNIPVLVRGGESVYIKQYLDEDINANNSGNITKVRRALSERK